MTTSKEQQFPVDQFIAFAGDAAELISFNRSVGQLYGALYILDKPMSLKELAMACKMSKGNASIHLRILEEWGAVQGTSRPGTREDYYTANADLSQLMVQRLRKGLTKRLQFAQSKLQVIKEHLRNSEDSDDRENDNRRKKIEQLESLLKRAESLLAIFQKLPKLQEMFGLGFSKSEEENGA